MRKLLAALVMLLFIAPLAKATDLYIKNQTGQVLSVAVVGSETNPDSINAFTLKNGQRKKLFNWGKFSGPIRFAFLAETGQRKYNFFETHKTFPVKGGAVKGIAIKLSNKRYLDTKRRVRKLPVIQQTYPKRYWLAGKRKKYAFAVKIATVSPATGTTSDW